MLKIKKTIAALLATTMCFSVFMTGCGGDNNANNASSGAGASNADITEDGKDKDGNVVDTSAFAVSLGKQYFTEEDDEIWAKIEEKSGNADKIVWRHGFVNRSLEETPDTRATKRFFIELKKELGDRVEFQFYPNATLGGSADQIIGGLQAKNFESYGYNVGAYYEYTKAFTPLDIGFLIPDTEAGIAVTATGSKAAELMRERCIEDCGINVLIMSGIGMRHITNAKKQINTLEDIKGLKIRTQSNNLHILMFEALGASPTPIAFSELFTALQQKTVDGQENPIANIFEQNYAEVQSYMTLSNHLYTAGAFGVNDEWLRSLPQDVQDVIDKAAAIGQEQTGKDLLSSEKAMLDYLATKMEVNELSEEDLAKFKASAESMWAEAGSVMGEDYWNEVRTAIEEITK